MKTIDCLINLEPYGIIPLTGEACGLSYRVLCDLTKRGKGLVEKALGVTITSENWNRGSESNPHIASIMLPHCMVTPIAVFALLESDCEEVDIVKKEGNSNPTVFGYDESDLKDQWIIDMRNPENLQIHGYKFIRTLRYAGTAGDRNIHVMSGRIS